MGCLVHVASYVAGVLFIQVAIFLTRAVIRSLIDFQPECVVPSVAHKLLMLLNLVVGCLLLLTSCSVTLNHAP